MIKRAETKQDGYVDEEDLDLVFTGWKYIMIFLIFYMLIFG